MCLSLLWSVHVIWIAKTSSAGKMQKLVEGACIEGVGKAHRMHRSDY